MTSACCCIILLRNDIRMEFRKPSANRESQCAFGSHATPLLDMHVERGYGKISTISTELTELSKQIPTALTVRASALRHS
jgi:hypothetical protein